MSKLFIISAVDEIIENTQKNDNSDLEIVIRNIAHKWNSIMNTDDTLYMIGESKLYPNIARKLRCKVNIIVSKEDYDNVLCTSGLSPRAIKLGYYAEGYEDVYFQKAIINDMYISHKPLTYDSKRFNIYAECNEYYTSPVTESGLCIAPRFFNHEPIDISTIEKYRSEYYKMRKAI